MMNIKGLESLYGFCFYSCVQVSLEIQNLTNHSLQFSYYFTSIAQISLSD